MRTVVFVGFFALAFGCQPAVPSIDTSTLDAPIIVESGVYNPWTDRCSDSNAPIRRKAYIRQPKTGEALPLFVFLIGTLRSFDNPSAKGIVDRAAAQGFVAASVDYDTLATHLEKTPCEIMSAKSSCTFSEAQEESIVNVLCQNKALDGTDLGLKVDCDKGIVAAGFSQGASVGTLAKNHNKNVRALWSIGMHNQSVIDENPMTCLNAGGRQLASERARVIVGANDRVIKQPHRPRLIEVTGRVCEGEHCFKKDGSGWGIVPNSSCKRNTCKHEYLDDPGFWETKNWWGVDQNITWLKTFVR